MLEKLYYWFRKEIAKPEERGEPSSGYWQSKIRDVVYNLSSSEEGYFLEVGCGEGLFLQNLVRKNARMKLLGIDISFKQLLKAKTRVEDEVNLLLANATSLPFKNNLFNRIVCINVIMNMPHDEMFDKSFQEMRRVCKRGGSIIFEIRNQLNPFVYMKYKLVKFYDATIDSSFLKMYKMKMVEARLQSLGFIITKKITIGFPGGRFAPVILIEARNNTNHFEST
jgi:ubiquinone/menaquinone biosynthesis C-methylase UbiE